MIGLGVMGRNLLLNMADHGFGVLGYDTDATKREALASEAGQGNVKAVESLAAMAGLLRRPRVAMMLVPAGAPVDAVVGELLPHLEPGDIIIDGGNSHYTDTQRRMDALAAKGIHFLGVGISGGERGARRGPSIMPGGHREAYERVRPIFEAVAARVDRDPCVTYLGPGACGHYVKMVHNGIEYGVMELIAECYDLMKRGAGLNNEELRDTFAAWNGGDLSGYLMEITATVFGVKDVRSGRELVDMILDQAKQKGTGMWMSQDAMDLTAPVPTIDAAVTMRHLSTGKELRQAIGGMLVRPIKPIPGDKKEFVAKLREALHAALILTYAQGMAQLARASEVYQYHLNLADVARIWRGGCIIRSALLEPIRAAYGAQPDLPSLLLDPRLAGEVMARQENLRGVIREAVQAGIPCAALMNTLTYLDGSRSAWLPANLIQAQRDCFGSHTYQRVDEPGIFHTEWEKASD